MGYYLLKRVLLFIPTLLGITLITFVLMQALPGDPVAGMAGERATAETIARIRSELGQDRPLPLQYLGYVKLLATGELGRSYYTNRKISDDLLQKFPNTLRLALAAMLFASVFGIGLGTLAAVKRGTNWDRLIAFVTVGGISIPVFWLGLALMLVFSLYLRVLPPSGMGNGRTRIPDPSCHHARDLFAVLHRTGDPLVHARIALAALHRCGTSQRAL